MHRTAYTKALKIPSSPSLANGLSVNSCTYRVITRVIRMRSVSIVYLRALRDYILMYLRVDIRVVVVVRVISDVRLESIDHAMNTWRRVIMIRVILSIPCGVMSILPSLRGTGTVYMSETAMRRGR